MSALPQLYTYTAGKYVPWKSAFLHISDLSIQRGYGVFDFFKISQGQPLFLPQYLDRFYTSAEIMGLPVPVSRDQLRLLLYGLFERNRLAESGVKMVLTGGYSTDGYTPAEPNLMLIQQPLSLPAPEEVEKGISIITHPYVRDIPEAKTLNYAMGIYLLREIQAQGAKDVLYHRDGVVSEFPRSNFFIVRPDQTIVTPAKDMLAGITRSKILSLSGRGFSVEVGEVTLTDIATAREAFQTSTTKRVLPIVAVDGKPVGDGKPGPVTLALYQELVRLEEQEIREVAETRLG